MENKLVLSWKLDGTLYIFSSIKDTFIKFIFKIGQNLPCIKQYQETNQKQMNSTGNILPVGITCPAQRTDDIDKFNQFQVSIAFEMPPSEKVPYFDDSKMCSN